jgi:uncharacterized protein with ATP-grasp and redox domains
MMKEYPQPIYSNVPGTWAHSTVTVRLPRIAARVIEENQFPAKINQNISRLQDDIKSHGIRPLLDQDAPDQQVWEEYIQPYLDQSWLEVPWFFAEHYFYRRIMEAVNFFQLGKDPFSYQKRQGLEKSSPDIMALAGFLEQRIANREKISKTLEDGLYFSLWGNQSDLSLWPTDSLANPKHGSQDSLLDHLLANDIQQVVDLLCGGDSLTRLDVMLDNAGVELVSDLALVDILLGFGLVKHVVLHTKAHPTYVSDVIPVDIQDVIDYLAAMTDQNAMAFGSRLEDYIDTGRMQIQSHLFWNSPLPLWELPEDLQEEWRTSSLVISKGDMNYRRILGDLQWDFGRPFQYVVDYLPVSLVALRTLKAELAVGIDPDRLLVVKDQDPEWLVNGRWGVIQFSPGADLFA